MDSHTQLLEILRTALPGVEHFIQETLAFESLSDSARIEWAVLIQHITKLQHNKTSLEECITQLQTHPNKQDTPDPVVTTPAREFDANLLHENNNEITDQSSITAVSSAGVEQVQNLENILNEEKCKKTSLEANDINPTEQRFTFPELINPICPNSDLPGECNTEFFLEQYTMDSQRQFCCTICSKRFGRKQHLRQHLIVHSGDKPYHCSFCVRKFIYPSLLRDHLKLHLNPPYSCKECSQKFIHKKSFDKHMQTHALRKPFSCNDCGYYYRTRWLLKMHVKKCHMQDEILKGDEDTTNIMPTIVSCQQLHKIEPIIIQDL